MCPPEIGVFRIFAAAFVGVIIGIGSMWHHGALIAVGLSPFFGSTAAFLMATAIWLVDVVVSRNHPEQHDTSTPLHKLDRFTAY